MFHNIQVNYTRGEATPAVHAREDIDLYRACLATLENFTIVKHGGIRRRSGTRYMGEQKAAGAKLVDFTFAQAQTYAIELGAGYARFWTPQGQIVSGSAPYEIASPFSAADLAVLQWAQTNDEMFFARKTGRPKVLRRFGHAAWDIIDYEFEDGPYLPINDTSVAATFSQPPYNGTTVAVTHSSTQNVNNGSGFRTTDVGRHYRAQWQGKWTWGTVSTVHSPTQIDVAIVDGGLVPSTGGTWTRVTSTTDLSTGIAHYITGTSSLTALDVNKTGLFDVEGQLFWADIKFVESSAKVQVVLGSKSGAGTSSTRSWRLGAFSDTTGWPGTVEIHDGRVCWGRTNWHPRGVAGSYSNTTRLFKPSEFDGTVTTSNGFFFDLVAGKADEILWMKDGPRLQLGTASAMRSLGSSSSQEVLGPRNVSARLDVESGTVSVLPVRVGPSTVHAGRFGLSINEMFFENDSQSLVTPEASILSAHMYEEGVARLVYTRDPESIVWALTSDGKLTGMTIERTEKVLGFSRHPMDGIVTDIVALPDVSTRRDVLMLCVTRTIGGVTRHTIERLEAPHREGQTPFFVDCGLTYAGAPIHVVTGLEHLNGAQVDILADGAVQPRQVVVGGSITLPGTRTASSIVVGLPIIARAKTLPAALPNPEGSTRGLRKRVVYVVVDMLTSLGIKIKTPAGEQELVQYRSPTTAFGRPSPLHSGPIKTMVDDAWDSGGVVEIICDQPLPATIRGLNIGIEAQP